MCAGNAGKQASKVNRFVSAHDLNRSVDVDWVDQRFLDLEIEKAICGWDPQVVPFRVQAAAEERGVAAAVGERDVPALLAWVHHSPHVKAAKRQERFDELAPLLRYHHMATDFLAVTVFQCDFIEKSKWRRAITISALSQREAPSEALAGQDVAAVLPNRGVPPSEACWELNATFSLEEIQKSTILIPQRY